MVGSLRTAWEQGRITGRVDIKNEVNIMKVLMKHQHLNSRAALQREEVRKLRAEARVLELEGEVNKFHQTLADPQQLRKRLDDLHSPADEYRRLWKN